MSNAHPTTATLPRAEQALLVLNRSLHNAELLSEYYAGSKFEPSIAIVIDLIGLAISIVETIPPAKRINMKSLTATAVTLAQRFGKLTPYRQQTALLLIIQLLGLWTEEK